MATTQPLLAAVVVENVVQMEQQHHNSRGNENDDDDEGGSWCSKILSCNDCFKWIFMMAAFFGLVMTIIMLISFASTLGKDVLSAFNVVDPLLLAVVGVLGVCRLSGMAIFSKQNRVLGGNLNEYTSLIEAQRGEIAKLGTVIGNLEQERNQLQISVKTYGDQNARYSVLNEELKVRNNEISQILADLEHDCDRLHQETQHKAELNVQLNESIEKLRSADGEMRQALTALGKHGETFEEILTSLTALVNKNEENLTAQRDIALSIKDEHRAMLADHLNVLFDQVCSDRLKGISEKELTQLVNELSGLLSAKYAVMGSSVSKLFKEHSDGSTNGIRRNRGWINLRNQLLDAQPSSSYRASFIVERRASKSIAATNVVPSSSSKSHITTA